MTKKQARISLAFIRDFIPHLEKEPEDKWDKLGLEPPIGWDQKAYDRFIRVFGFSEFPQSKEHALKILASMSECLKVMVDEKPKRQRKAR